MFRRVAVSHNLSIRGLSEQLAGILALCMHMPRACPRLHAKCKGTCQLFRKTAEKTQVMQTRVSAKCKDQETEFCRPRKSPRTVPWSYTKLVLKCFSSLQTSLAFSSMLPWWTDHHFIKSLLQRLISRPTPHATETQPETVHITFYSFPC